jgi:acyl-CoA synthetase (AMP-forming)/AMP-acid ligase II
MAAGGVVVPLNTRYRGGEAADILSRSRARFLICVNGFLGTQYLDWLREAKVALPDLDRTVVLAGDPIDGAVPWNEFVAAGAVVPDGEIERRVAQGRSDDVSDILFTSGTTGRPKGVMTTHGQVLRVYDDLSTIIGVGRDDRYLIVIPFFHTFGYRACALSCLMRGAAIVPQAVLDVDTLLATVAAERITTLPGPPTLFLSILDHPDRQRHDLSSLRSCITGAAAVPVELIRRLRDELGIETILTGYGLTEATGCVTMCHPEDSIETVAHTSGRPLPGVEVRVVDADGRELPRGEPGEVLVRGYNVMVGYLDDPQATGESVDGNGWLHTGDVGTMDVADGVQITDRTKDMFIAGGFNAYPAEIEGIMLRHPAIAQVAVIGVPDERLGEVAMAFVVPRSASQAEPEEVIGWCRNEMANFKVPRHVRIVDELPLTASGKVMKGALREIVRSEGPAHR